MRRGLLWAFNVLLGRPCRATTKKAESTVSFFARTLTDRLCEWVHALPCFRLWLSLCVCCALCVCVLLLICVFYKQRRVTNTTMANAVDEVTRAHGRGLRVHWHIDYKGKRFLEFSSPPTCVVIVDLAASKRLTVRINKLLGIVPFKEIVLCIVRVYKKDKFIWEILLRN
jgi:hypothetical protein